MWLKSAPLSLAGQRDGASHGEPFGRSSCSVAKSCSAAGASLAGASSFLGVGSVGDFVGGDGGPLELRAHNFLARLGIRQPHVQLPVDPSWSHQRGVEQIGPVCGADDDHAAHGGDAVELDQQLRPQQQPVQQPPEQPIGLRRLSHAAKLRPGCRTVACGCAREQAEQAVPGSEIEREVHSKKHWSPE